MFINSMKEVNRLAKKIDRLLSKECQIFASNFLLRKSDVSKLRFYKFKKFVSRTVFGEFQLPQISLNFKTFCCNLKVRGLEVILCVPFYYFNFERNYDVLKLKRPCILLNKNINFNKNETESKMEGTTHSFRETKLVLQLI